ncbi:MAG TPA: GNAT family N-acetyltransferase [Gammaproteobacteria bacterium]|nr:GNAT family N-acetyltransferase [Gammaproteobacteria bacterium]
MLLIARLDGRRHDRNRFDCGVPALNIYLQQQAAQHHRNGIATTHVLIDDDAPACIVGYYTLAAAQLRLSDLMPADQRRLPRYPVPAARLARLAISLEEQGRGLGESLLQDAVKRCLDLRAQLGMRVLLVDAKDGRAAKFYAAFGFRPTAIRAFTLYLPLGRAGT